MLRKIAVSCTRFLLKNSSISIEDRNKLVTEILDKLAAIPFRDIITIDEQGLLLINNRPVDIEQLRLLRESARFMLQSPSRKIIRDQVAFQAVTLGVHKAETPEQMYFAKVAIWWYQQEDDLLKLLAGEQEPT